MVGFPVAGSLSTDSVSAMDNTLEHGKTSQVGNPVGSFKPVNSPKLAGKS